MVDPNRLFTGELTIDELVDELTKEIFKQIIEELKTSNKDAKICSELEEIT